MLYSIDSQVLSRFSRRSCKTFFLDAGEHTIGFTVKGDPIFSFALGNFSSGGKYRPELTCYSTLMVEAGETYEIGSVSGGRSSSGKSKSGAWIESKSTGLEVGSTLCNAGAEERPLTTCSITKDFPKPVLFLSPSYPTSEFMNGVSGEVRFVARAKRDGSVRRVRILDTFPEDFGKHGDLKLNSWFWRFDPADLRELDNLVFKGLCQFRHPANVHSRNH